MQEVDKITEEVICEKQFISTEPECKLHILRDVNFNTLDFYIYYESSNDILEDFVLGFKLDEAKEIYNHIEKIIKLME